MQTGETKPIPKGAPASGNPWRNPGPPFDKGGRTGHPKPGRGPYSVTIFAVNEGFRELTQEETLSGEWLNQNLLSPENHGSNPDESSMTIPVIGRVQFQPFNQKLGPLNQNSGETAKTLPEGA